MPPAVSGDEDALVQLLQNLISNGIKFRHREPVVVNLTSRREGDRWRISVEDNGIGIDAQHHAAIFAPFKRLHSRQEFDGSGIGLATCRRIVDQHGGRLWVESEVGQGATFHFTLSDASADALDSEAPTASRAAPGATPKLSDFMGGPVREPACPPHCCASTSNRNPLHLVGVIPRQSRRSCGDSCWAIFWATLATRGFLR